MPPPPKMNNKPKTPIVSQSLSSLSNLQKTSRKKVYNKMPKQKANKRKKYYSVNLVDFREKIIPSKITKLQNDKYRKQKFYQTDYDYKSKKDKLNQKINVLTACKSYIDGRINKKQLKGYILGNPRYNEDMRKSDTENIVDKTLSFSEEELKQIQQLDFKETQSFIL